MKRYCVVEIENNHPYHQKTTSYDGENLYVWGEYAGRKGVEDILNYYASQGWELVQLVPVENYGEKFQAIFVR